jgi:hypothetical protein
VRHTPSQHESPQATSPDGQHISPPSSVLQQLPVQQVPLQQPVALALQHVPLQHGPAQGSSGSVHEPAEASEAEEQATASPVSNKNQSFLLGDQENCRGGTENE